MAGLAVTGSTGSLGGRITSALADLGVEQRLIVRRAERAPRLDGAEVLEVPGGYADPAGYREALAGVERIVYTSLLGAAADSTFEAVTGRPPQTLEQTLGAHPELLSGDLPG